MTEIWRLVYVYRWRAYIFMTNLKTLFFLLATCIIQNLHAQVNAPTLMCIRADTLFWSPATNTCGPFVSTDIYFSNNFVGPYSVVATITDESITSFHHPVSGNAFYFLRSNNDCPGFISLSSDTLDNLPLAVTRLEKVTVQEDGVLISWYDNNDAKTIGYIIYRSTPQGTVPIDTVYGLSALQYLDPTAAADSKAESYYVIAIDQCGNTGLFDAPHNTVYLETELDYCQQFMKLTWNPYGIWPMGHENVEIWLGIDGDPLAFEHRVQLTDTLAYLTGIIDNREYCVAIKYKEQGRDVISTSNVICQTTDVITPLTKLLIRNVSVRPDGQVEVLWDHNASADLAELNMNRGDGKENMTMLVDLSGSRTASDMGTFNDLSANTSLQPYYYSISALDDCDTSSRSNSMASILLKAEARSATETQLNWTGFDATGRTSLETQLCRIEENGAETLIYSSTDGAVQHLDVLDQIVAGSICYKIKVVHTNITGSDTLISTSNLACVEPKINMFVPNAFVPSGANRIFKPEFANVSAISDFNLQIFNRWGGKIFESSNPDLGWDGTQEGHELTTGVYLYLISLTQPDGKTELKSGTIQLIR